MKYKIIFIDKVTGIILDETERSNFSSAAACCMQNESDEIICKIKEE